MKFQCTMCDEDKSMDAFPSDNIPGDPAVCWECFFPLAAGKLVLDAVLTEQSRILGIAQELYDEKRIGAIGNMMLVSRVREL